MIKVLKKNKINIIALLSYIIIFFYNSEIFYKALDNSFMYLKEMLEILPAVMVVSGLIGVWVPKELIIKNFGKDAGLKGKFISVFIGSISAGPIYAAFPFTQTLLKKGASISNVIIIISSWAVVKIPMLIVETKFLGIKFAGIRYLLTVPGIIFMGYVINKILSREDVVMKNTSDSAKIQEVEKLLAGFNCGACGYNSCRAYAEAIVEEKVATNLCTVTTNTTKEIVKIL